MAWKECHPVNGHPLDHFPLKESQPVPRVEFAARIVRKAGEYLDFMTARLNLFSERQSFEKRLRLKPLGQKQDAHFL